jgi:hypothetical protein
MCRISSKNTKISTGSPATKALGHRAGKVRARADATGAGMVVATVAEVDGIAAEAGIEIAEIVAHARIVVSGRRWLLLL